MRAREDRYKHSERFPELKNIKIIKQTWEGDLHKQERHLSILGGLPAVLQALMPGGDTVLVEKSVFDNGSNRHTFQITPSGMTAQLFTIDGISNYFSLDAGNSARNYEIKIHSGVFLAGGIIESALAELYQQNSEKDKNSILEFIKFQTETQLEP